MQKYRNACHMYFLRYIGVCVCVCVLVYVPYPCKWESKIARIVLGQWVFKKSHRKDRNEQYYIFDTNMYFQNINIFFLISVWTNLVVKLGVDYIIYLYMISYIFQYDI